MKIVLFDLINETHVCAALHRALEDMGHVVVSTGKVWQGHRAPLLAPDLDRVEAALATVLDDGCDALLNFRASTLAAHHLRRLRDAGVLTAVWLPDDPVLYAITYRAVVDHYDHVFHCGTGSVLRFYASHGHAPGIACPFWVDPEQWAYEWSVEGANDSLVFMGNLHNAAKQGRYAQLAQAGAARVAVYGKCASDPVGIHRGELHGVDAIRSVCIRYAAGVNIPQHFSDYAGTRYDFPGLSALGTFDLPSRVIQYAAMGLPVLSLGHGAGSVQFKHVLRAPGIGEALSIVDRLRARPDSAQELSRSARADVVSHFSARARAGLLSAVFTGELEPGKMGLEQRALVYREFSGSQ